MSNESPRLCIVSATGMTHCPYCGGTQFREVGGARCSTVFNDGQMLELKPAYVPDDSTFYCAGCRRDVVMPGSISVGLNPKGPTAERLLCEVDDDGVTSCSVLRQ